MSSLHCANPGTNRGRVVWMVALADRSTTVALFGYCRVEECQPWDEQGTCGVGWMHWWIDQPLSHCLAIVDHVVLALRQPWDEQGTCGIGWMDALVDRSTAVALERQPWDEQGTCGVGWMDAFRCRTVWLLSIGAPTLGRTGGHLVLVSCIGGSINCRCSTMPVQHGYQGESEPCIDQDGDSCWFGQRCDCHVVRSFHPRLILLVWLLFSDAAASLDLQSMISVSLTHSRRFDCS